MSDIEIEIDGKVCQAKSNAMVIQVADEAGIYIPRFCYHKHLSIAANCRMCLVEVEKSPKALPACATPVMPGMKVFTKTPKALAAQKAVMEFLLINHPLDCPICDQGGECELQDLSMGFGAGDSFYHEGKRTVKDKDIGPLISTDMTRCIQCTRCVRFGTEIAGIRELGALGRGGDLEIGTYIDHAMESEVSGNVIDICPVGALTSKPFRFIARAWELQQYPSISPHDCIGANINVHTRSGTVMRVVPRENTEINETWIADRDRYSYEALYHTDRVTHPMIKKEGVWQETDWQTALEFAVGGLQRVLSAAGAEHLGALVSPSATLEEMYLLQKLVRGIGSDHIDHRLRQVDFSDDQALGANIPLAELENCDAILLVGSNVQKEQPSAALRIRKAALKGARVMAVNAMDYDFHFDMKEKNIVAPDEFVHALVRLASALSRLTDVAVTADEKAIFSMQQPNAQDEGIAKQLLAAKEPCLVLGAVVQHHPKAALIRRLCHLIAKISNAEILNFVDGANAAGAVIAGAVPQAGLNAQTMLQDKRKAYFLLNVEPNLDCANPVLAREALQQAEFVVSLSLFKNTVLSESADVILPISPFTETFGTYVNASGQWQTFKGCATAFWGSRPAWKVLRVLGSLLRLEGFEQDSAEAVLQEVRELKQTKQDKPVVGLKIPAEFLRSYNAQEFVRLGAIPIYAVDSLVRRATALQNAQNYVEGDVTQVRLHPKTAKRLLLDEGDLVTVKQRTGHARMPLAFDARLPERCVFVAGGISETDELHDLFGVIEIHK